MTQKDFLIQSLDTCENAKDVLEKISFETISKFLEKHDEENKQVFNSSGLSYTKKLLYKNPNQKYDIFLIHWGQDAVSKFHDHAESGCAMYILKGTLLESRISYRFGKTNSFLTEGNTSYIDNKIGFHKIQASTPSLSMHIYFPGGFETNYF